jgi:hypothetical protein
MMNRWRFAELTFAAVLLVAGSALLYYATADHSITAGAVLISGAAFFSLGAMMAVSAGRSFVWHRRMIRHAMPRRGESRSPGHNHGMVHRHR